MADYMVYVKTQNNEPISKQKHAEIETSLKEIFARHGGTGEVMVFDNLGMALVQKIDQATAQEIEKLPDVEKVTLNTGSDFQTCSP